MGIFNGNIRPFSGLRTKARKHPVSQIPAVGRAPVPTRTRMNSCEPSFAMISLRPFCPPAEPRFRIRMQPGRRSTSSLTTISCVFGSFYNNPSAAHSRTAQVHEGQRFGQNDLSSPMRPYRKARGNFRPKAIFTVISQPVDDPKPIL